MSGSHRKRGKGSPLDRTADGRSAIVNRRKIENGVGSTRREHEEDAGTSKGTRKFRQKRNRKALSFIFWSLCFLHVLFFVCGAVVHAQEEQVQKVRTSNALKFQQLEATVQEKLEQAQTRREQLEQEQKEKLKSYVSISVWIWKFVGEKSVSPH